MDTVTKINEYLNEVAPLVYTAIATTAKSVFFKKTMDIVLKLAKAQAMLILKKNALEMIVIVQANNLNSEFTSIINKYSKFNIRNPKDLLRLDEHVLNESIMAHTLNLIKKDGWKVLKYIPALQI
jgi:galactokinase/mevalonate kinase-like predicted kinase